MLSPRAHQVIQNYLSLPFPNLTGVNCPYFINRGNKIHGGLRVLVGKGTPADIVEEAMIISLRDKLDLSRMNAEQMKKFLVDNHLGVDCSALAYYILDAELQARGKGRLGNALHYPYIKNIVRKLLVKLRSVENTGVKTLAHDDNSITVPLSSVRPGDMIIMLGTGKEHDYDHVLIVNEVTANNEQLTTINYVHALRWQSDGQYNHGVRQGKIIITDIQKSLLEQRWVEQEKEGVENETYEARAKLATKLEIRQLASLSN